ncbi:hypothetical protein GWI33_022768 [Rhynchophorus ferrugineus]|uniref:Uncharacterized protein n=1 Tax=Rhynchophorus ferrugineus TaxID=354439 RepID=A0A834IQ98_RHYFE|nr:hypothetical protein GWI33_022768 [Rhynchophorus ferrugineus]
MATTKVIFVALLAAFALQASASRAPAIKGAFDDVIDLAEHVLKLVTTVVDDAIEIATTSMNTVITKLEDFQQNADKYAKQIVEAELKVLNELIDDFKNNTDGIVKEVLECVESVEGDLSDLEEYALKEAAVCTNGSIATVVQDAEQFVTDFSQVSKQVEAQADALEEFKSQLIPVFKLLI